MNTQSSQRWLILVVLLLTTGTVATRDDAPPIGCKIWDDKDWHVLTGSRYDSKTGEWHMEKFPVHHIID